MSIKTIQVKPWGKEQGDFVLINEEDFDSELHELYGEKKLTAKEKKELAAETAKAEAEAAAKLLTETKAALTEKGIEFDPAATQADLQALLDKAE